MKKSDIVLIAGVAVVIIIGIFLMGGTEIDNTEYLHKLSYDEYQEKIDNGDNFIVIIERTTCSHCQNFMPVAKKFAKSNKIDMYYIDTDEMKEEDWNKLTASNSFFEEHSDNWGTPVTIVLDGSKALDYIEGETDSDSLLEMYEKYFEKDDKESE